MKNPTLLMTLSVLLGALLLFGMEPMVGRMLVPFYGSAVSTWLTALMFFQVVLFGGYLYAHLVARRIGKWHLVLLLLPLLFMPIGVTGEIAPEAPTFQIVLAMAMSIGVPFFVLSTTAVVLQLWWSRSELGETREPYPLYAASNTGSLAALLGYPFLIEPFLGLRMQSYGWTVLYVVYVGVVAFAFFAAKPSFEPVAETVGHDPPPTLGELALWALIAALPSGFLLAVTTVIATEVGSFPMVWIFPLAVYLGTFVLLFRDRPIGMGIRRYWPEITALGFLASAATGLNSGLGFLLQLGVFFLYCMALHGELYARRPGSRYLTRYYLAISFGGGVGGTVVNFGPPVLFDGLWEHPLLVLGFLLVFIALMGRQLVGQLKEASLLVGASRLLVFQLALALAVFGFYTHLTNAPLAAQRNFYGVFRVMETDGLRMLVHGSTQHGSQWTDPAKRDTPTGYFYPGGGLWDTYHAKSAPRNVAVFGLGAGVVASYLEEGDRLRFYEIDPDNEAIAREWFTWLEDSKADVTVSVGDGRLKMLADPEATDLDILHLDAFSGDGIPSHLLTVEAVEGYRSRLAPDGLLLFHISNRYYDLRSITKAVAEVNGMHIVFNPVESDNELGEGENPTVCAVASMDPAALEPLVAQGWVADPGDLKPAVPWTDDWLNVLGPLTLPGIE